MGTIAPTELARYMLTRIEEWRRGNKRGATIAVVGPQGSGKTTYAYYSVKQAYIVHTCKEEVASKAGSNVEQCVRRVLEETCWGLECVEPDDVDKELREHIYVSVDDVDRLIKRITERREIVPFVFVDDLGVSRTSYHDRTLRPLYLKFLRAEEWRRSMAINLVLTAVYESRLAKDLKDSALFVYASFHQRLRSEEGTRYNAYRYVAVKRGRALTAQGPRVLYHPLWIDVLPASKTWAMPPWLEDLINERKRELLKTFLAK